MTEPALYDMRDFLRLPRRPALSKDTPQGDWDELGLPAQEALASLVRESLVRLIDDPSSWLPQSVVRDAMGVQVGIVVTWNIRDVDLRVLQILEQARQDETDAIAELQHLAEGRH